MRESVMRALLLTSSRRRRIQNRQTDMLGIPQLLHEGFEFSLVANDGVLTLPGGFIYGDGAVDKFICERGEFQFAEEFISRGAIGGAALHLIQIKMNVEISSNLRQLAGLANQLSIILQRLAIAFVFDLFGMFEGIFN